MLTHEVKAHCAQIECCNQRGGRMLSFVDLMVAGTISCEIAAYSLAAIGKGASFMVGAVPGGAGKTAIMGALLNFVPSGVSLYSADTLRTIKNALVEPKACYVCHEIGNGHYYAYLWDEELRAYFELPTVGHMMATNLHADTLVQARDQVCGDNAVAPQAFRRMSLAYFVRVERLFASTSRRISAIWESDGESDHRQICDSDNLLNVADSQLVSEAEFGAALQTIDSIVSSGVRTIEDVRTRIVDGRD